MTVSVAMATLDGEAWVRAQIESIAAQTALPSELVVSDDGSVDRTVEIIRSIAAPFDIRVMSSSGERLGVARNFAKAIEACRGDIVVLADQDDVWHPERIEAALPALETADLVACDLQLIAPDGAALGTTQFDRLRLDIDAFLADPLATVLRRNVVTGAGTAVRAELARRALPIADGWLHDEWLAVVAAATGTIAMTARPLVSYRQHEEQAVGGAVRGVWAEWRHARHRMGRSYLEAQVARSAVASTRLEALGAGEAAAAMGARSDHFARRSRLPEGRFARLRPVLDEWRSGGYARFAYGWKSAVQDLLVV